MTERLQQLNLGNEQLPASKYLDAKGVEVVSTIERPVHEEVIEAFIMYVEAHGWRYRTFKEEDLVNRAEEFLNLMEGAGRLQVLRRRSCVQDLLFRWWLKIRNIEP